MNIEEVKAEIEKIDEKISQVQDLIQKVDDQLENVKNDSAIDPKQRELLQAKMLIQDTKNSLLHHKLTLIEHIKTGKSKYSFMCSSESPAFNKSFFFLFS